MPVGKWTLGQVKPKGRYESSSSWMLLIGVR